MIKDVCYLPTIQHTYIVLYIHISLITRNVLDNLSNIFLFNDSIDLDKIYIYSKKLRIMNSVVARFSLIYSYLLFKNYKK